MTAQRDRAEELRAIAQDMRDELRPSALSTDSFRALISHWAASLSALAEAAPGEATFVSVEFACNKCGYCGRQGPAHNRKPGLSCEYEAVAFAASTPPEPERAEDRRDAEVESLQRRLDELDMMPIFGASPDPMVQKARSVYSALVKDAIAAMQADKGGKS